MIDGVVIKNLVTHSDERGFFREIFRFQEEFKNEKIGQISHSKVEEGVIKAWHGHKVQTQWNYVVNGKIKVVLYDNRENSKSFRKTMEFYIGDEEIPKAYFFPPGILHGYQCLKGPMNIVYVTSGAYHLEEEIKLPIDDRIINYNWY